MSEQYNPWNVGFSRTSFLFRVLSSHDNVLNLRRERDILFLFNRKKQGDEMRLLGCDEYVFSLALAHRAVEDFGPLNMICVGGKWNGYSRQAREFCEGRRIGLYNVGELNGALRANGYWNY